MAKPWDDSLKKLVHADPQAFVSWFVPGASFIGARPHELKNWTLELEQGLEQGLQRGQLEALRQAVIDVVVERFPKLVRLAKKQVAVVEDSELLRHVLVKVSVVQTAEEAKQHLLALEEADE